jgi:hypothetical protein
MDFRQYVFAHKPAVKHGRSVAESGMFTVFDCFQVACPAGGAVGGFILGFRVFGVVGAIAGTVLGLVVGMIVGRLPWMLTLHFLQMDLKRSSTSTLRDRVKRQYYISHLIIAELVTRGEPLETLREVVSAQLNSLSKDECRFGLANAKLWFADLVNARDRVP